ncbi:PQQ-dependent sugar dehydrogenase [Undibacterium sp. Di26W]|uniref:PQQ-dependent sugar dehydrogenase n=1 Tax=Undibacterium sp. Di26W TaxID=3413035 RepID=UPI003BF23E27
MKIITLFATLLLLNTSSVLAGEGGDLYKQSCAQCHGAHREGGVGPSLLKRPWVKVNGKKDSLQRFISEGLPNTGMPAWKNVLNPKQIAAIAEYLLQPEPAAQAASTKEAPADTYPELKKFRLPVGFSISVYSDQLENARGMAVTASGIVFVGSRKVGKIYAVINSGKDSVPPKVVTVATGLDSPIGLTLLNGSLYVAEMTRVIRFDDIEKTYEKSPQLHVVKDDFPKDKWHGEKIIKAGPDGKLYIPIGAPCNVCDKEDAPHSKIYRMNPDGSGFEIYARGIRNSVGFAWHPVTREMWFTDNGRDEMGDNMPSDKLNYAPKPGMHFGFPYCAGGVVEDPEFHKNRRCEEFAEPAAKLGPHVASLGLAYNEGTQFPAQYKNQLFIAEHGSWNRTQKIGYRVALITLHNNKVVSDTVFVDGFLQDEKVIGRPVDIAFLPDGSMLISDDFGGRIYRVSYSEKTKP